MYDLSRSIEGIQTSRHVELCGMTEVDL